MVYGMHGAVTLTGQGGRQSFLSIHYCMNTPLSSVWTRSAKRFVLLALMSVCLPAFAADEGREMIRDLLKETDLTAAVIVNAGNKEMRDGLRQELLKRSPDSAKSIDGFLNEAHLFVMTEMVKDGHKFSVEVCAGKIGARSRSLLLSQGLPKSFIKPTAAILSIKVDGNEIKGEQLDAFGAAFAQADKKPAKPTVLNSEQEKMVNAIFDKDLVGAIVLGRKNPEWRQGLAKVAADHPGLQARLDSVDKSITHVVGLATETKDLKLGAVIALGDFSQKSRDAFVAGGLPEQLVAPQAVMLSVRVNGEALKGDKLQDFAEAFRKAPVTEQPSLIELSK